MKWTVRSATAACTIAITFLQIRGVAQIDADRYRITVWLIRPTLKRIPTEAELKKDSRHWTFIWLDEKAGPIADDEALLARLRHENPNIRFDRVRFKTAGVVASDTAWTAELPKGTQFTVQVHRRDRRQFIDRAFGTKRDQRTKQLERLLSRQIMISERVQMPAGPVSIFGERLTPPRNRPSGGPFSPAPAPQSPSIERVGGSSGGGERMTGCRGVFPNVTYLTNNGIGLTTNMFVKNPKTGRTGPVTVQTPQDLLLFRIDPLPAKEQVPAVK